MIRAYELNGDRLKPVANDAAQPIWWDLFSPTREEEQSLEALQGVCDLPRDFSSICD